MSRLVASAEARMLTRLLPNSSAPIRCSRSCQRRFTSAARRLPSCARVCMRGREAAVIAVSDPEKKAENTSSARMPARVRARLMSMIFYAGCLKAPGCCQTLGEGRPGKAGRRRQEVAASAPQRCVAGDGGAVVLPCQLVGVVERAGEQRADLVEIDRRIEIGLADAAREHEGDAPVAHLFVAAHVADQALHVPVARREVGKAGRQADSGEMAAQAIERKSGV